MQTPFLRRLWFRLRGRPSEVARDAIWWRRHLETGPMPAEDAPIEDEMIDEAPLEPGSRLRVHQERLGHRSTVLDPQVAIDLVRFDPAVQGTVRLRPEELRVLVERIGAPDHVVRPQRSGTPDHLVRPRRPGVPDH